MRRISFAWSLLVILPTLFAACGDDGDSNGGGGGDDEGTGNGGTKTSSNAGGAGGGATGPICTMPDVVPCEDQLLLDMNLQDDITNGEVSNTPEGSGFHTLIDATAGGAFATNPESYTYARFTDAGLEKVSISDEDSITSMDWDIAFRRYIVRINSGNSGPSCVTAARVPGGATYDSITEAPSLDTLTLREDTYFTDSCDFIADGTGLEDSPATALSSYWTYPNCVQMTGNAYIVQLADARLLKLTVTHFYNEAAQADCQENGGMPSSNSGSGNIQIRWSFL